MKKTIFFLALTCIFMASCNEDLSTNEIETQEKNKIVENAKQSVQTIFTNYENKDVIPTPSKFENGKEVTRTFKIHRSIGEVQTLYPSDECNPNAQVIMTGAGNATFVGNFNVLIKYCVDINQTPTSLITADMTAANGDIIYTLMIGSEYKDAVFYSYYTIIGGTGKFTGAYGDITLYGLFDGTHFDVEGGGSITF
jgi:hypothetical protein